jgi:PAS domain S-box-containing protein
MARKVILFAGLVVGLQLVQIVALGPSAAGGLVSDLLQIAASVAAAAGCFGAARRARGVSRPFWLLFGAAMVGQLASNVVWTWYQDWQHVAAIGQVVPRIAVLLRTLFLTMLVFRDPDEEHLDVGSAVDFVQLSIIYALSILVVDYGAEALVSPTGVSSGTWMAMLPRIVLLAVALMRVGRVERVRDGNLHRAFLLYLAWYLLGEGPVDYVFATRSLPTGTWLDLAWTVPALAVFWWARAWKQEAGPEPGEHSRSLVELLVGNAPFALAPFVVLLQTSALSWEHQDIRYALLAASILCFAVRLGLSEFRRARQLESLERQERAVQAAHEELQGQMAYFELLIECAPEGIAVLNQDRRVERINGEFTLLFGYRAEEAHGRLLSDLVVPEDRMSEVEHYERQSDLGKKMAVESVRRTKEGTTVEVSVVSSAVDLPDGQRVFIVLYRDIRQRHRVEAQLAQAQKMEAVGRLAGGVAHDFNNLLTVINGYSDMLLSRLDVEDDIRKQVEPIRKAGEQATELTRQLLAFGRKQAVRPGPVDLNALIADSERMFSRLIGEDLELSTVLGPCVGEVMADRGQLHQVLMNLLANARDAMPGGGKIVIETRAMALDEATARENGGLPLGQYVLLSVADTGPGMSALIREHIFEPFFTTKKKGEGTGLGLSIVYGIVRHSGGWITVDSEPGKGSTFRVLLPRAAAGVRERPVVALRSPDAAGGETLLLVEDQDEVREFAARVLQGRGYRVLLAAGGEAALALAGEFREPIHLLVTDVVLPGMSGYQIAGRLRESRPGIKVLYASGYPEAVIQQHRGLDVAVEVMRKPFAPDELAAKVREVLGS